MTSAAPSPAPSPALAAALRRVETVFDGMTAPAEGCLRCFTEEELALLAVPGAPLGDPLLRELFHEGQDHFPDHDGVIRRILPEFVGYVTSGRFSGMGYLPGGLGRTDWRTWPPEQAAAIEGFLDAWWRATLADPAPVDGLEAVWDLCLDSQGALTPLLDVWAATPRGGTEDRHLADFVECWIDMLLRDDGASLLGRDDEALLSELQAWLAEHAVDRLAGHPDPLLARKTALLALEHGERWVAHLAMDPSAGG